MSLATTLGPRGLGLLGRVPAALSQSGVLGSGSSSFKGRTIFGERQLRRRPG